MVTSFGFYSNVYNSTIFFLVYLCWLYSSSLYFDSMTNGNRIHGTIVLKHELASQFEMKKLGPLSYFFTLEVVRSPKGYLLS